MPVHEHHYQHYALLEDDSIIEILRTSKDDGHTYRCPYCKQELIAKRGQKNIWHFAHKKDNPVECSYDRYLHSLAETKILEWYNNSPEVNISLRNKVICKDYDKCKFACEYCLGNGHTEPINLKDFYNKAELERGYKGKDGENYIADIMLTSDKYPDSPIFLEIYVTHECTKEKKESGIRIIEIPISSEEDIDKWIDGRCWCEHVDYERIEQPDYIREGEKGLRFYGFHAKDDNSIQLKINLIKCILYKSGKYYVDNYNTTCQNYKSRRKGIFEVTLYSERRLDISLIMARAKQLGIIKKRCEFCQHMSDTNWLHDIPEYCDLFPTWYCFKEQGEIDAEKCNNFVFKKIYDEIIDEYRELYLDGTIDEWYSTQEK